MKINFKRTVLSSTVLAYMAWAACAQAQTATPPSGAILNQLNQGNAQARPTTTTQNANVTPFEALNFVGDNSKLIGLADVFQRQFIGKKVSPDQVIQELNAYVQKEHGYPVTFIKSEADPKSNTYGYIDAIKYEGVKIQNSSKLNSKKLEEVLNYNVEVGKPVDVAQLERNTTVASELPGVVNQFGMIPGQSPNSTALGVTTLNDSLQSGYLGVNNEGNDSLGKWQATLGVVANNAFGNGERLTFNGQLTEKSQYGMMSFDTLVHPSGTRVSINASALDYSYHSTTISNNGFTNNDNKMTGFSNSYWLEVNQPLIRTEISRTNGTLGAAYKTNKSNSDVVATTTANGSQAGGVSTADFALNDNRIEEGYIDLAGATGLSFGNVSYDVKYTYGNAKEFLTSGAGFAQIVQSQYGPFHKGNIQGAFTSLPYESLYNSTFSASTSIQLANRNLVSAEQMYVGGAYQMRGWGPQILGGADVAYLELAVNVPISQEINTKVFLEEARIKTNISNYKSIASTTPGSSTGVSSANGNLNSLGDIGLSTTYKPSKISGLSVTTTLAAKFGKDPKQFGVSIQDNSNYHAWLRLIWAF